jgi:predicted amidohydrolase
MSDLGNSDGMAGGRFKVAAVQRVSAPEVETNLARADALAGEAAAQGAKLRCG